MVPERAFCGPPASHTAPCLKDAGFARGPCAQQGACAGAPFSGSNAPLQDGFQGTPLSAARRQPRRHPQGRLQAGAILPHMPAGWALRLAQQEPSGGGPGRLPVAPILRSQARPAPAGCGRWAFSALVGRRQSMARMQAHYGRILAAFEKVAARQVCWRESKREYFRTTSESGARSPPTIFRSTSTRPSRMVMML